MIVVIGIVIAGGCWVHCLNAGAVILGGI